MRHCSICGKTGSAMKLVFLLFIDFLKFSRNCHTAWISTKGIRTTTTKSGGRAHTLKSTVFRHLLKWICMCSSIQLSTKASRPLSVNSGMDTKKYTIWNESITEWSAISNRNNCCTFDLYCQYVSLCRPALLHLSPLLFIRLEWNHYHADN